MQQTKGEGWWDILRLRNTQQIIEFGIRYSVSYFHRNLLSFSLIDQSQMLEFHAASGAPDEKYNLETTVQSNTEVQHQLWMWLIVTK